jgi:hypothetical protein
MAPQQFGNYLRFIELHLLQRMQPQYNSQCPSRLTVEVRMMHKIFKLSSYGGDYGGNRC